MLPGNEVVVHYEQLSCISSPSHLSLELSAASSRADLSHDVGWGWGIVNCKMPFLLEGIKSYCQNFGLFFFF
jgi:hypothetical protein